MKRFTSTLIFILTTSTSAFAGWGSQGGGSQSGVLDASYLVLLDNVTLTADRDLTFNSDFTTVDNGANGLFDVSLFSQAGFTAGTFGNGTNVAQFTVNQKGVITAVSNVAITAAGAPTTAQYVVSVDDAGLSADDLLTGGNSIAFTNGVGTATLDLIVNTTSFDAITGDQLSFAAAVAGGGIGLSAGVLSVAAGTAMIQDGDGLSYNPDNNLSQGIASGTAAAPGLFFTSDTSNDLGLYRISEGVMGFTDGTGRVQFSSAFVAPITTNAVDLGSATVAWQDLFLTQSISILGTATGPASIVLEEDSDLGASGVTITVPSLAANYTLTLPPDDGVVDTFLRTDGSGVLTWTTPAGCGGAGAPTTATYYVNSADGTLSAEIVLTGGNGLDLTAGAMSINVSTGLELGADAIRIDEGASLTWESATTQTFAGAAVFNGKVQHASAALPAVSGNLLQVEQVDVNFPYGDPAVSKDQMPFYYASDVQDPFYPTLAQKWFALGRSSQTDTSMQATGFYGTPSFSGTAASLNVGGERWTKWSTVTVTNDSPAGINGNYNAFDGSKKFWLTIRFRVGPATETDVSTHWIGASSTGFPEQDNPPLTASALAHSFTGLARDPDVAGGNYLSCGDDGTDLDCNDTGIAFVNDSTNVLVIYHDGTVGTDTFWLNGSKFTKAANIPVGSGTLGIRARIISRDAGATVRVFAANAVTGSSQL